MRFVGLSVHAFGQIVDVDMIYIARFGFDVRKLWRSQLRLGENTRIKVRHLPLPSVPNSFVSPFRPFTLRIPIPR